jgi:hypothetical protein
VIALSKTESWIEPMYRAAVTARLTAGSGARKPPPKILAGGLDTSMFCALRQTLWSSAGPRV